MGARTAPDQGNSDDWDNILDPGEQIIWSGRPDTGISITPLSIFMMLFGAVFTAFAVFWMIMAYPSFIWMFGLIHFSVGVAVMLGAVFGGPFRRKRTWYTLTTHRALIATDLPIFGKKLDSYPIEAGSPLSLNPGSPGSVYFGTKTVSGKYGKHDVRVGFERINDADHVFRLLREIQEKQK